jgi:hypothetical protein
LETYFHSDPRIQEWVNQITEAIFTGCQLTGADSEAEFQKGSQIVTNLTQLLQGISIFPSEYLEDGLKQLLEQQIPDSRTINIPAFQDTMNKMLHEGMMRAIDTQNIEALGTLASTEQATPETTEGAAGEIHITHFAEDTGSSVDEFWDDLVTDLATPALAPVSSATTKLLEVEAEVKAEVKAELQVPEPSNRLKTVLSNLFPDAPVCWDKNLMGQTFVAQVEDILICLNDSEQPYNVENLNKEGWKVYECSSNDLLFPRRLERGIKEIQRLGKQGKNR